MTKKEWTTKYSEKQESETKEWEKKKHRRTRTPGLHKRENNKEDNRTKRRKEKKKKYNGRIKREKNK